MAGLPQRIIDYSGVRPASRWYLDSTSATHTHRKGAELVGAKKIYIQVYFREMLVRISFRQ